MAGTNLPTYGRNESAVTSRAAEYSDNPDLDFNGGMNLSGSCSEGIGINTGGVNPKTQDWTLLDQFSVPRTPQGAQHIGITGLGVGSTDPLLTYPIQAAQYDVTPGVDDLNDTLFYVVAAETAAPGVGVGVGNIDPINRTDQTVQIGDLLWATNTVA
jgi:hypothetical protein